MYCPVLALSFDRIRPYVSRTLNSNSTVDGCATRVGQSVPRSSFARLVLARRKFLDVHLQLAWSNYDIDML